jgi:3-deoxy-7-phosphoheptulonate synthase
VGADGLIVETHHDPSKALCDGQQSLDPKEMSELLRQVSKVAGIVGKKIR